MGKLNFRALRIESCDRFEGRDARCFFLNFKFATLSLLVSYKLIDVLPSGGLLVRISLGGGGRLSRILCSVCGGSGSGVGGG